jgi:ABC-type branched-subunit amino acid transport system substrate-binding protein
MKSLRLFAAAALLAAACQKTQTAGKVIPIGAVIDRTGSVAVNIWPAELKLAFDDANAGLAAAGKDYQFTYLISDSTNNATVATQRAMDLVHNYDVRALVADTTRDDIGINTLAYDSDPGNDLNVPIVCYTCNGPTINNPTSTDPDPATQLALRNGLGWNFRTVMSSKPSANVMIRIARQAGVAGGVPGDVNGDGKFKISVYATNESFGKGFAAALAAAAKAADSNAQVEQILFDPTVDPNSYNWDADIARLVDNYNETTKATDGYPDIIFSISGVQLNAAFRAAYVQGGQTIRLMHNSSFRSQTAIQKIGSLANGAEGVGNVNTDGPSGDIFRQELMAAGMGVPEALDAMLFDSANLTMLAAVAAVAQNQLTDPTQVSGAQIRDALHLINDPAGTVIRPGADEFAKAVGLLYTGQTINYDGASGPVDFDAMGNIFQRLVYWNVQNQQFVDLVKYDCVSNSSCPAMQ